jgi:hypothetical protein
MGKDMAPRAWGLGLGAGRWLALGIAHTHRQLNARLGTSCNSEALAMVSRCNDWSSSARDVATALFEDKGESQCPGQTNSKAAATQAKQQPRHQRNYKQLWLAHG